MNQAIQPWNMGLSNHGSCHNYVCPRSFLAALICTFHFLLLLLPIDFVSSVTHPQDVDALIKLYTGWNNNLNLQWDFSKDPCDDKWIGISCNSTIDTNSNDNRVTSILLLNQDLSGSISPAIGNLTYLKYMDLSSNSKLGGSLPAEIGNLQYIERFYVQYCNMTGSIPSEVGKMISLQYLGLSSNNFTGPIPPTVGYLTNMIWFDVSYNKLDGPLPVSDATDIHVGLDNMNISEHLHLQGNQFTGTIPSSLFKPYMRLLHLLLAHNNLTGGIPSNINDLRKLDIIRLDYNFLNGTIPATINTIQNLTTLQLNHNQLTGDIPNLSNNTKLRRVMLESNSLSGTLDLKGEDTSILTYIDVSNNRITGLEDGDYDLGSNGESYRLIMYGNPYCSNTNSSGSLECTLLPVQDYGVPVEGAVTSIPTWNGGPPNVPGCERCQGWPAFSVNPNHPQGCQCVRPVIGTWHFYALKVFNLSLLAPSAMTGLTKDFLGMWRASEFTGGLPLDLGQVFLDNTVSYNTMNVLIFPPIGVSEWDVHNATIISFVLQNQDIWFQSIGPMSVYFWGGPYSGTVIQSKLSTGAKIGIAMGSLFIMIALMLVGVYAMKLRKRALRAEKLTKPFASWISGKENADIPQLKGARWFSLEEIQKCTNNFSHKNEIGVGGYGKVYKGDLPSGETVAIKRSCASSLQGAAEFKNEIELLSRVHHRNLVGLVGFCFEEGEQMLVYKYMPNGTLRESLAGKTGVEMTWDRRIELALGAAKGIAYLHNEANPPIIHRDIKSNNILLDEKLVAMVADFGLSKLAPVEGCEDPASMNVKGTLGYLDPNYYMTNQLTNKSDVYSFGVVLLELITARQPIQAGKYIVMEVEMAFAKGGLDQMIALKLLDPTLKVYPPKGLKRFLELAIRCVQDDPLERPTMIEVVKELEDLAQVYCLIDVSGNLKDQQQRGNAMPKQVSVDIEYDGDDSSFSDTSKARVELYGKNLPYLQQSFGSSSFDYSGSYEAVSRPLNPK